MGHEKATERNYWEDQLERSNLKEPNLVSKKFWLKPLTVYHALEFRGLDKRDSYEPHNNDAWDFQAWNTPGFSKFNKKCADYYLDLKKCHHYLKSEFPYVKKSFVERKNYCWKMHDNYTNCKRL